MVEKFLYERYPATARLFEISFARQRIINSRKEKEYKAADILVKVRKLFEQDCQGLMFLCAINISELRENTEKLPGELETKELELHTMPGLVELTTILWSEVAELRNASAEDGTRVTTMDGLRKEVSGVNSCS